MRDPRAGRPCSLSPLPQLLSIVALGLSLAACSPCDGIIGCSADPGFAVSGRMVDWRSGEPVAAVVIDVLHAEGSIRTETDAEGFFSVHWSSTLQTDSVRLRVHPPAPYLPYEGTPVAVRSSSVAGDGTDLGRWVANPFHAYVGQVRLRKNGTSVSNARVTFEPHDTFADAADVLVASTDWAGNFVLSASAPGGRTTIGRLTIEAPSAGLFRTIDPFALPPRFVDEPLRHSGVIGIGHTFGHYILLHHRGGRRPIPANTEVHFVQTGGVPIIPSTIAQRTQPWGAIALIAEPQGVGNVVGNLTVFLPEPWGPEVVEGLTLPTTESDQPICCVTLQVGPRLPTFGHYLLLYFRGPNREPIPAGTEVRFVQTGGVPIEPSTIVDHSKPWGAVALIATPERAGTVTGNLTVFLPDPWGTEVIEGITLPTTEDELPICCTTIEVGPKPPKFGHYLLLYLRGSDREPIPAGTEVRFVQTGGVPIEPSTIVDHSKPWGAVALIATPERAGTVTGNLTVFLPDPWGTEVIEGITLPTTEDELPICCTTIEVGPDPGR